MSGSVSIVSQVTDDTDVDREDDDEDEDSVRNGSDVAELAFKQAVSPTRVRVENSSNVHIGSSLNYNAPVTINQFVNVRKSNDSIDEDLEHHAFKAPAYVGGFTTEKNEQPIGKDVSAHWLVSRKRHLLVWGCLGLVGILVIIIVVTVTTALVSTSSDTDEPYTVPEALVEPLYPRGLRVSIPDSPDLKLFAFHGNINKALISPHAGSLSKNITSPRNGRWVFENTNVELKKGDIINYWTYVIHKDGQGSYRDNQQFVVVEFITQPTTDVPVTTPGPYSIPDALVEPLYPRGLRVSIPDSPDLELFSFHGNINKPFYSLEGGTMAKDIIRPRNGRWVFEDANVELKKGDVIYYWTYVVHKDGRSFRRENQQFVVVDFITESTTVVPVTTPLPYSIPDALVEPLYPRGLRVSIPDSPDLELFFFHGNINKSFYSLEGGTMSKDIRGPRNDRWVFEDTNVELKKGDVIYYWTYVIRKDRRSYRRDNQQFVVVDFITEPTTDVPLTIPGPYSIPDALVEPLYPRGLRVSIPDSPDLELFAFHGNLNKPFYSLDVGTMAKDIIRPRNGRWVFEDTNVELKKGDVIYYWTYVVHKDGRSFRRENQQFVVVDFITEPTTDVPVTIPGPYSIPDALVEPLYPRGLRVSIPDSPDLELFSFHGNINKPFYSLEGGTMSKDIIRSRNDRWVFEDTNVELKKGDVIYYWTYVVHKDGRSFRRDNQQFVVVDFITESTANVPVTSPGPYTVPEALVEPLYPRGLRVSIPDCNNIKLFAFHGNINERLSPLEAGTISKDVVEPTNGRWVFEDTNVELKKGDTIYYWTYVILKDDQSYRSDNQQFVVEDYSTPSPTLRPEPRHLKPTVTKYHCSKRIF